MKRITVLSFVLGLAFAASAAAQTKSAATDEPQAMNKVQRCTKSGGVYKAGQSPECDCGDKKQTGRFNLMMPGTDRNLQAIFARAKYKLDMCENVELAKTSSNIKKDADKGVKPEKPTPFSASLDPDMVPSAKAGTPVEAHLSVTSGAAKITQIRATCDNCLMNGKMLLTDGNVRPPKVKGAVLDYPITLTPADPNAGGPANLMVTVITSDGGTPPQFPARITWESKVPCANGTVVANACTCPANTILNATKTGCDPIVCTNGTIANNACTCPDNMALNAMKNGCEPVACANGTVVKGQCTCLSDTTLNAAKNACVKAEKESYANVGGTRILTGLDGMCGRTDHFRTCNLFVTGGVSWSVYQWDDFSELRVYGKVGLGAPGGTKHDTAGKPVLLADGREDKRWLSALVEAGLQLRLNQLVEISLGANRLSRGTRNSVLDPSSVTTSAIFGMSFLMDRPYATFGIGPRVMVGVHGEGSGHPTETEFNAGLVLYAAWGSND